MANETIDSTPKCPICKGGLSYEDSSLHQVGSPLPATLALCIGANGSKYGGCGYKRWTKKAKT